MRGARAYSGKSIRTLRLLGATGLALILACIAPSQSVLAQSLPAGVNVSDDAEMLLEADTVIYDNDRNTITAVGGVQIDYDGNRLVAQRVAYDRATSRLIASGGVEIVDPSGTRIYSDQIDVTDDFRDAFVRSLRVETADKTYFAADSAERANGELTTFNQGVYTACEPCAERPDKPPLWQIKAQKIIWNGKTKTVRFERARFEFFGSPLAFLPAFEIADPTVKQKSGFLAPSFRSSSELGYGATVPYYWALSPSYDITFKPTGLTRQGFLAEAEWRQRFDNGEYSLTIAGISQQNPGNPGWPDGKRERGMVGSKGKFQINPRWSFGWDVMVQSDKVFAHRYGIDGFEDTNRTDTVYLTGLNDRNYFDLRFHRFAVQEAHPNDRHEVQPWVLPSFDYSLTPQNSVAGGELKINVNAQGVMRDALDYRTFAGAGHPQAALRGIHGTSARLTAEAEWKRSFVTPGGLMLTPLLHARGDAIGVDYRGGSQAAIGNVAAFNSYGTDIQSSYYRPMATAGLEARWPILITTENSTHVIEPMGQLFVRPDAAHSTRFGIPNEDAQSLVFDASNLFERDKFSGYDRVEGGTRANLGVRYSAAFANGWSANGVAGQSFHLAGINPYTSPDLVHVGAQSGLESARSDYVASVGVISPNGFSLSAGGRFDEENLGIRRADITAGYASAPVTVSGAYSFIEKQPDYGFAQDRHEIRANASVRVAENWRIFGGGTYDFESDVVVAKSIGFAYDDDCFAYTLSATEYVDRTNPSQKSQTFGFAVSLRTLGEFGSTALR